MTDSKLIQKRRARIIEIIGSKGCLSRDDIKALIIDFGTSSASIMNDVLTINTGSGYRKHQSTGQNTRARKKLVEGTITENEWQDVLRNHNYSCANCGKKTSLEIDHIKPISKGGANTKDNIQPLCRSCNSRKGNR